MRLERFEYSHYWGKPNEWALEGFELGPVNLLVGQNATGKTRCLRVIAALALLLSGKRKLHHGGFVVDFKHDGKRVRLELRISGGLVEHELLIVDDTIMLKRNAEGVGTIYADVLGNDIDIGLEPEQVASILKRDKLQHPFLDDLGRWAQNVRYYEFARNMGEKSFVAENFEGHADPAEIDQTVALFMDGRTRFPDFEEAVRKDMQGIGYEIDEITVGKVGEISVKPMPILGFHVKEKDLPCNTEQPSISQGMFRALSILIHVNYGKFGDSPACIVLDDIGEGLDFDRSTRLIRRIVELAEEGNTQLIMATNDRFVMNAVPLDSWAVMVRDGPRCRILNKKTSPEVFDDFKFTGLNNFDFFATEFWAKDQAEDGDLE